MADWDKMCWDDHVKKNPKLKDKLKILNWSINVKWSNGVEEDLTDCDDDTASAVDTWLTEIEDEKNKQASEQKG
jgi:hypothetical protein|tara:strand:+ start:534 stop:755 length:222 start_codon:yes stop_codon:yes gene_type:complete